MGPLNKVEIMLTVSIKSKPKRVDPKEHFWTVNVMQYSCISRDYTQFICIVGMGRIGGISCGTVIISLGSSGGQPLKQLSLALTISSDI